MEGAEILTHWASGCVPHACCHVSRVTLPGCQLAINLCPQPISVEWQTRAVMRARQPNAQEREQLRRQRSETRLILAECRARDFEYVVNPPVAPKVAFGSTMDRATMPKSSFMLSQEYEVRDHPSPLDYDCSKPIGFKYPSNAGFSALASKVPRLPKGYEQMIPPIGTYDIWPSVQHAGYTFNKQVFGLDKWLTPGPSTYACHKSYPYWKLETAFGTRRIIWPAVAVFCGPHNVAQCLVCRERPKGDYFHSFVSDKDMCRQCMADYMAQLKRCTISVIERERKRQYIKQFVKARYCSFFHNHEGTNAATETISRDELRAKIRAENYLYRYVAKQDLC